MTVRYRERKRNMKRQRRFKSRMLEAYCPEHERPRKDLVWDPVLHEFHRTELFHAVYLYAPRFRTSMDAIFGEGSLQDLSTAGNGLFLHVDIEQALRAGVLAIVPDIELDPDDLRFPFQDSEKRKQRLRDWEQLEVKEYRIIVVNPTHPTLTEPRVLSEKQGIYSLLELDGRKLTFLTNFRPHAQYIWWTFLVSVTVASRYKDVQSPYVADAIGRKIRAAIRCWNAPSVYINRHVLQPFIVTIGQDAESLIDSNEERIEPDDCALKLISRNRADTRNIKMAGACDNDENDTNNTTEET